MVQRKTLVIVAAVFSLGMMVIGFQNCSRTNFTESEASISLKTEDMNDMNAVVVDATPAVSPSPSVNATPVANASPVTSASPVASVSPTPKKVSVDSALAQNSVECDLKRPHSKVIISETLQAGSNARVSRLCMSENACLKIVNAYANVRNCSLAAGAPSMAANSSQCTAIFPGSKGTCKHAQILTDAQISTLLATMSGAK